MNILKKTIIKTNMNKLLMSALGVSTLTIGCLSLNAENANALSFVNSNPGCSTSNLTTSSDCDGIYEGNNSNQDLNGLFGITDWGTEIKVDASSGTTTSNGITLNVTDNGGASSGTWSLSGISLNNYNIMAVLKGGPTFTAYLLDSLNGTWNNQDLLTDGQNPSRGAGLSHFSVYTSAKPVPEPLTILGTGLALGLGGLFKSKQQQKFEA